MRRHLVTFLVGPLFILSLFVLSSPLQAQDDQLININTATVEVLQQLDGIGETLAQRIVAYREDKHPFASKEEIQEVNGIGKSKFESIQDEITVK